MIQDVEMLSIDITLSQTFSESSRKALQRRRETEPAGDSLDSFLPAKVSCTYKGNLSGFKTFSMAALDDICRPSFAGQRDPALMKPVLPFGLLNRADSKIGIMNKTSRLLYVKVHDDNNAKAIETMGVGFNAQAYGAGVTMNRKFVDANPACQITQISSGATSVFDINGKCALVWISDDPGFHPTRTPYSMYRIAKGHTKTVMERKFTELDGYVHGLQPSNGGMIGQVNKRIFLII